MKQLVFDRVRPGVVMKHISLQTTFPLRIERWFRPRISYLMWCQQPVIKYNVGCWLLWFLPQAFFYIYITNIQNPSSSSNIWNKGFPNGSRSGGGNTIEIKFFRIKYNLNEAINIRFKSYFLHSVSCWLVAVEWPRPSKTIGWCQAESHCFMLFYIGSVAAISNGQHHVWFSNIL